MSARSLRREDDAVSEVIGYILGFFMSFILLIISLYAFSLVSNDVSNAGAHARFKDIATRVASAVLEAVDVGSQRASSTTTATTTNLLYVRVLDVPGRVEGLQYTTTLTTTQVTVAANTGSIQETAPNFNLRLGTCSAAAAVCTLSGSVASGYARVVVKYQYLASGSSATCAAAPVASCVTISG